MDPEMIEGISKYLPLMSCEIIMLAHRFLVHSFVWCHTLGQLHDSV